MNANSTNLKVMKPQNLRSYWTARRVYQFSVAQICNLLHRRIALCGTPASASALELSDALPITNRRYGRLQICATRPRRALRACFKIPWGPAARNFGCGQGGEAGASPKRAVRAEPTQATAKRTAARRVFAEKAAWLRCSSVTDPFWVCSLVAPRHLPFPRKQDSTQF